LPHLSVAKRGYVTKSYLAEAIQYILYRLKNGLSVAHNEEKERVLLSVSYVFMSKVHVFMPTHEKRAFSLNQMNNVELARTLSCQEKNN